MVKYVISNHFKMQVDIIWRSFKDSDYVSHDPQWVPDPKLETHLSMVYIIVDILLHCAYLYVTAVYSSLEYMTFLLVSWFNFLFDADQFVHVILIREFKNN